MVKQIKTKTEFDEFIKSNSYVIVDFTATWCGPCKTMAPKFEELSKQLTDVKFIKVDVDECSDIAEACGVSAMPTFKFFKNGAEVGELVGANEANLRDLIVKHSK